MLSMALHKTRHRQAVTSVSRRLHHICSSSSDHMVHVTEEDGVPSRVPNLPMCAAITIGRLLRLSPGDCTTSAAVHQTIKKPMVVPAALKIVWLLPEPTSELSSFSCGSILSLCSRMGTSLPARTSTPGSVIRLSRFFTKKCICF